MRWEDVAPTLETGDLMLFRDRGFESRAIQAVVRAPFSHVAMVLRTEGPRDGTHLYLWQATTRGVVVDPLRWYLARWCPMTEFGTLVVRPLLGDREPAQLRALHDFLVEAFGRPFARNDFDMFVRWAAGQVGIDTGERRFFCAQLVAETLKRMGLLTVEPPSNKYSERDFAQETANLRLLRGFSLGDETIVTMTAAEVAAWAGPEGPTPRTPAEAGDLRIAP